jgi:hypothetical protein
VLTQAHRQEALSRAYIAVIAARCGFNCSYRAFDYGVDTAIHEIREREGRYSETGITLDVQAKSTIGVIVTTTHIQYDLDVLAYNDLRNPPLGNPRILVLLVLPDEEDNWTDQSEDRLEIRHCAYWMSLTRMPATKNKRTIRISIPRANIFSVAALAGLMERVRNGEVL